MTTVLCLHAAVAQKSYGSEKRFLCPPPIVRIDCAPNTFQKMRRQQLAMSIVSETGDRAPDQRASLDEQLAASFKYLHVAGTAKAKSFRLALDIYDSGRADDSPTASTYNGGSHHLHQPWASFDSAPVTIISKPSKKSAKTRNISSCILAGGPVSLFNRINAQTVRTKYMTVHDNQLSTSNAVWLPLTVDVVRRPSDAPLMPDGRLPPSASFRPASGSAAPAAAAPPPNTGPGPQPVTYGSMIILTDPESGITSGPLIVRKVDKGRICNEDGGPVSQMQKIALQRAPTSSNDLARWYLSAASSNDGTPAVTPGAVQAPPSPLQFQSPAIREDTIGGARVVIEEVDDYFCWTIVGISKFQYSFFDASGQGTCPPPLPITPFPTLYTLPIYRPPTHTMELTVSNFFYPDPASHSSHPAAGSSSGSAASHLPLEVWLGTLGPLRQRIYQATAPHPPRPAPGGPPGPGGLPGMSPPETAGGVPPPQTIVIVDMPPMADIVRLLQESASSSHPRRPPIPHPSSGDGTSGEGDEQSRSETGGTPPSAHAGPSAGGSSSSSGASATPVARDGTPTGPPPTSTSTSGSQHAPHISIAGRTLPILLVRTVDRTGYYTGRAIACENVFQSMTMNAMAGLGPPPHSGGTGGGGGGSGVDQGWLAAAQAAAGIEKGLHGWTLRVL